jgi:hypothetical protein
MTRRATPTAAVSPKSTMTSRRPPGRTTSVASNSHNTIGTACQPNSREPSGSEGVAHLTSQTSVRPEDRSANDTLSSEEKLSFPTPDDESQTD